jgi:hypothetical protein
MDPIAKVSLELVGAYCVTAFVSTGIYTTYLLSTRRRQKIKSDRLLAFGILSPVLWLGMTAISFLLGATYNILPGDWTTAATYAALLCYLPALALSHSVIEDESKSKSNNNNSR